MMRIIKFEWDHAKGEDYNGKSLVIGQHLPKTQNENFTHVETYGISLDIIDSSKDYQLQRHTCYGENIVGEISTISKEEARTLLYSEIDRALDIMYDEGEMRAVDENLNVSQESIESDNELY
jgi:hypothetical protein